MNVVVRKLAKVASAGPGAWMAWSKSASGRFTLPTLFDKLTANSGITMDIAQQFFTTPHRHITVLDAPGHKDFTPNMISGASQADCALLVVDAATGEFEAGFERGGQTREHVLLVRSLGVSQVIVAVNKLDQVGLSCLSNLAYNSITTIQIGWTRVRYDEIESTLRPFLVQSGVSPSKTSFVPLSAILGVNLIGREGEDAKQLNEWYSGPTLIDCLGMSLAVFTLLFLCKNLPRR